MTAIGSQAIEGPHITDTFRNRPIVNCYDLFGMRVDSIGRNDMSKEGHAFLEHSAFRRLNLQTDVAMRDNIM